MLNELIHIENKAKTYKILPFYLLLVLYGIFGCLLFSSFTFVVATAIGIVGTTTTLKISVALAVIEKYIYLKKNKVR